MTPDPTIRIQSVMRTLEHLIFPAVDPSNSLAIEQCGLVLAQLRMLIRHVPHIGQYHALCRDDLVATVEGLPSAGGGTATRSAASRLHAACEQAPSLGDASAAYHQLGFALEGLMRVAVEDGAPEYRRAVDAAVLAFSHRQSRRERSWFQDAGFDPYPDTLPDLAEMVAGR